MDLTVDSFRHASVFEAVISKTTPLTDDVRLVRLRSNRETQVKKRKISAATSSVRSHLVFSPKRSEEEKNEEQSEENLPKNPESSGKNDSEREPDPFTDPPGPPPGKFFAGQWVDVFIPELIPPIVGGFTICSGPGNFKARGYIELAVKKSKHPPAAWFHSNEARKGAAVRLRVGGNFYLDPAKISTILRESGDKKEWHYLFIAGGVGINPFRSMLQEIFYYRNNLAASKIDPSNKADNAASDEGIEESSNFSETDVGSLPAPDTKRKVVLLYSAKTPEDILFHEELSKIEDTASSNPTGRFSLKTKYFITKSDENDEKMDKFNYEKIGENVLKNVLQSEFRDVGNVKCFICGPPPMINDMCEILEDSLGLEDEQIECEKWW